MRLLAAAGGTGGHLYPALAVADELLEAAPGTEVHFAVSRRGLEARVLRGRGFGFTELMVEGFHRREIVRNLLFPLRAVIGQIQSILLIGRERPQVAFGTGGFVSGPVLLAAWLRGIPFALIALDARPGLTLRLLAPLARRIYVANVEAGGYFGQRAGIEVVGTPVRTSQPLPRARARKALGLPVECTLLLITGGSQGSQALNGAVAAALPRLLEVRGLCILWQAGSDKVEEVLGAMTGMPVEGRVFVHGYLEEMYAAWSAADLAIGRAGASTVAELCDHTVPSILVPLPSSAGGHQEENAAALAHAGAAIHIPEAELDPERLAETVASLVADPDRLAEMAARCGEIAHTGSARRVARGLVEIARGLDTAERDAILVGLEGRRVS